MATQDDVISSVRRRVADFKPKERYEKSYYQDAIAFALNKLSFDFGENYTTVPEVPQSQQFLLIKLATIEMCYIRAAESAEGESGDGDDTRWTTVTVPDLSVTDNSSQQARGAAFWVDLARRLQSEYDDERGDQSAGSNQGAEVEQFLMRKISLTNGGFIKRVLDPGLPAVTVISLVDSNDVMLTWNKLIREDFLAYEVYRDVAVTMKNEERLFTQPDIHEVEFVDENVAAGSYFYRVKSLNPNELRTNSNTVSAVVA